MEIPQAALSPLCCRGSGKSHRGCSWRTRRANRHGCGDRQRHCSRTHGRMVTRDAFLTVKVAQIYPGVCVEAITHFHSSVTPLVANLFGDLTLSRSPDSLESGHNVNSGTESFCRAPPDAARSVGHKEKVLNRFVILAILAILVSIFAACSQSELTPADLTPAETAPAQVIPTPSGLRQQATVGPTASGATEQALRATTAPTGRSASQPA